MRDRGSSYNKKLFFTLIPFVILFWELKAVGSWRGLIHANGISNLFEIGNAFFSPDLSPEILKLAFISSWKTLAYATAGISVAIFLAVILGTLASGIFFKKRRSLGVAIFRGILNSMRAVHELIWAWLFVAAVGLSPFAAILALAISYGGTLGKIFADILNDVPEEPIASLRSAGTSQMQLLFYGYFPIIIPNMISYTMYRYECAIRSSAIMSFIGLGGLGFQISLSLSDLEYREVWTFVFFLIGLVLVVEVWSNEIRKRLIG